MAPRRSERLRKLREAMNSAVQDPNAAARTAAANISRAARRVARARRATRQRRARASRAAMHMPTELPRAIFGGVVQSLRFVQESQITWLHLETLPFGNPEQQMGPDEQLILRVLSLFIRIALVESPSLVELTRRNPNQGIRKLIRIIRFLFFRH